MRPIHSIYDLVGKWNMGEKIKAHAWWVLTALFFLLFLAVLLLLVSNKDIDYKTTTTTTTSLNVTNKQPPNKPQAQQQASELLLSLDAEQWREGERLLSVDGEVANPAWPRESRAKLYRIGPHLVVRFSLNGVPLSSTVELRLWHTGSWGKDDRTYGRIRINGTILVSDLVPANHLESPYILRLPPELLYFDQTNELRFDLSQEACVWWVRKVALYKTEKL